MGRAEDLFRRISVVGVSAIEEFITTRKSEELFLDFKRSSSDGKGQYLSDNDRNSFAKAISGFGNSEGGVLVWGVDCSKDNTGADIAKYEVPIQDAPRFASWLQGVVSGCTVPPHQGVQVLPIVAGDGPNGFIVCLIPKSNHAPHQVVGRLQYYIRAGSDFVPVPHAVLAGMFGRAPQPNVSHRFVVEGAELDVGRIGAACGVSVMNSGPGIANDIFLNVRLHSLPGPNCELRFERCDVVNWGGTWEFGRQMSLISQCGYRLPPEASVMPLTMHIIVAPPFEKPFQMTGTVGTGTSTPHRFELKQEAQRIQEIYDVFLSAHAASSVSEEQSQDLVIGVLGLTDIQANG